MGFSASVTPLEGNENYGQHPLLDYAVFSQYFNEVKNHLLPENFSGAGGDRNEISIAQGRQSLVLTYLERGYLFNQRPAMLARIVNKDQKPVEEAIHLPEKNEEESKAELTSRWTLLIHSRVKELLDENGIYIDWFELNGESYPTSNPPTWPNPDE